MGLAEHLLAEDERVVLWFHPHWKRLVLPFCALIAVAAASGAGMYLVPGDYRYAGIARITIAVVSVVALTLWSFLPYLYWKTTTYTLTNRRLSIGTGIFDRSQDDIPMSKINSVSSDQGLLERLLGCGTLIVESAAARGELRLRDIPKINKVRTELFRLVEEASDGRPDDE